MKELDPAFYGFTEKDLDREFYLGTWNMEGFMAEGRQVGDAAEAAGRGDGEEGGWRAFCGGPSRAPAGPLAAFCVLLQCAARCA